MSQSTELPDSIFLVDVGSEDGAEPRQTLSFSRAPTVLLTFAANRFTRSAARLYQREFGIGAMDWRMLVMLTRQPGCSVAVASSTIGIDKAAVSRSLSRLEALKLATATATGNDERRKQWSLTVKGQSLHDDILAVALERLKEQLAGFSQEDVAEFNRLLALFLSNLSNDTLSNPNSASLKSSDIPQRLPSAERAPPAD